MSPIGHELARAAWAQAWQVTVLIAVVALATRLWARNRPHLAHVLWLVVLIKCVTPPVFSSASGVFCWMHTGPPDGVAKVGQADSLLFREDPVGWALPTKTSRIPSASEGHRQYPHNTGPSDIVPSDVEATFDPLQSDASDIGVGAAAESEFAGANRYEYATTVLFGGWALGTFGMLVLGAVRWVAGSRRIRRCACRTDRSLDRLMVSLSQRLRLRRPARLVITESLVGPAVIGLFRPTVLLPETVVREKSAADLEPILAHELIHARRGDTWVGVLQMLAQAVWWFHPLVWWAGRLASREAERCCDEAVLAELGCDPARYARCLLDILQQENALKPLPAFPGVRPVEVTSRRLERIMRLGQGSRKYSPWWCWAVMLLAAAVTLPGAALVAGADEDAAGVDETGKAAVDEDAPTAIPSKLVPARGAARQPAGKQPLATVDASDSQREPLVSCVYRVGDLLVAIRSRFDLDEQEAKDYLLGALPTADLSRGPDDAMRRCTWSGAGLVVSATAGEHESLASTLESLRVHGFDQIRIQVHLITGPSKSLDKLGVDWETLPVTASTVDTPQKAMDALLAVDGQSQAAPQNRTQMTVQKSFPLTYAFLDEKQTTSVLDRSQRDRRCNVLQAPQVTLFSGQPGVVSDCSQSPFVVGFKDGRPQTRIVSEGTVVRFRAVCGKRGRIRLEHRLTLSKVRGVETVTLADGPGKKPLALQVPEVATFEFDGSVGLPIGSSLLIGKTGIELKDDDSTRSLFVLLRATRVVSFRPPKPAVADCYTVTYSVADLVVPIPDRIVASSGQTEADHKPAEARADFESLIDLITSTIRPATWKDVGGRGDIAPFDTNLSLVVSQTQEVHEEIVNLFEQLRRLQDLQIALNVEIVHVPQEMADRMGIDLNPQEDHTTLKPREARIFRAFLHGSRASDFSSLAKITVFNGQQVEVPAPPQPKGRPGSEKLLMQAVVSEDRRSVRLTVAVAGKNPPDPRTKCTTAGVADGHTLLYDVTDQWPEADSPKKRTLLLLTPRNVIPGAPDRF